MRSLLFIVLVGYAVRCNDASYYVIEMPEESRAYSKPFRVYWNVPTMQCGSKKIPFRDLYDKFGIIQNSDDSFRGEKVAILYDPGLFPALLKNETSGKFKFRNGGVPQEGDLEKHLLAFRNTLEQSVPDENFAGIGIIDFESWRPVFRQNFGVLIPYKDISYQIERKLHWYWPEKAIQAKARQRFEESGRAFMQTTLSVAKQLRPRALWGYYGFPYCFNMATHNMVESCSDKVKQENDKINWLWSESSALFPSIYSSKDLTTNQLAKLVRGRVTEAARVARGSPVLPYFWFRYREGGFLSKTDLNTVLEILYKSNASGFIIWGSSNDVNTVEKCNSLLQYTEEVLGPAIAKYTKPTVSSTTSNPVSNFGLTTWRPILRDHLHNTTTSKPTLDPEYHWIPPENYTQDIIHYVNQELKKKPATTTDKTETEHGYKENFLIDIILHIFKNDNEIANNEAVKEIDVNIGDKNKSQTSDFSTETNTGYNLGSNTSVPPDTITQNPLLLLLKDKKKGISDRTHSDNNVKIHENSYKSVTTPAYTTKGYESFTEKSNENSEYTTNSSLESKENTSTTSRLDQVNDEVGLENLENSIPSGNGYECQDTKSGDKNCTSLLDVDENISTTTEVNKVTENGGKMLAELLGLNTFTKEHSIECTITETGEENCTTNLIVDENMSTTTESFMPTEVINVDTITTSDSTVDCKVTANGDMNCTSILDVQENLLTTTEGNKVTESYNLQLVTSNLLLSNEILSTTTEKNDIDEKDEILSELLELRENISVLRKERSTEVPKASTSDNIDSFTESNLSTDNDGTINTSQANSRHVDTPSTDSKQNNEISKHYKKGYVIRNGINIERLSTINSTNIGTTEKFNEYGDDTVRFTDDNVTDEFIALEANTINTTNNNINKNNSDIKDYLVKYLSTNNESTLNHIEELIKSTTDNVELFKSEVPDVEKEGFRIESEETTTYRQEVVSQ